MNLVVVKNPFDRREREVIPLYCAAGIALSVLHAAHIPAGIEVCASINGEIIPRERWGGTALRPGDQVVFVPSVHDDVLRTFAFIALAVFAPQVAVALAPYGATALTLGLYTAAVMVTGGMLINYLLPPPTSKLPTMNDIADVSPAYSWQPATTQQQGAPVARWYGVNKLVGNVIGAYIEDRGDKQYLNALIDLGLGPYKRLYDFYINGQPVTNFQGVVINERRGQMDQSVIEGFNDTKVQYGTSVKVVKGTPYTYTTTGSAFNALEVGITFPQGLWHSNDSGGLDAHSVDVQIEVRKTGSSDTWEALTHSYQDVMVVSTPAHWSRGRWVENADTGVTEWSQHEYGSADPYAHYEGELGGYTWGVPRRRTFWRWIDVPEYTLANVQVDYARISAAQTQPIRRTFRVDNLPVGQYDVRITNLTDDQTSSRYGDDLYLTTVTEVIYDDFTYPRTVLVAIEALATNQLSGSLNFSCIAECAMVRIWNGSTWSVDVSDNPAWVCWDILTQPVFDNSNAVVRYDGIDPARLDLTRFKAWADFCDAMVPDGSGGTEKRCTFNGGFDTELTMWDAALQVCNLARAVLVWNGINLTVNIDQAQSTPVQLFSVGNIGADSFKETFLPVADRAAEIEVDFINKDRGYERDKLTVFNTGITSTVNKVNLQLFGITRPSQAWREAMYRLYRNQYITRTCEIVADVDSIACTVGDLISVQHDVPIWGQGGRLVDATSVTVTLDKTVTIETGKTYQVTVRLSDDTLVTKTVLNGPGDYSALIISPAFSVTPAKYDVYAFGETAIQTKPFVVISISRSGDQRAVLTCVEYNAMIYNVDTEQPVLPTVNYTSVDTLPAVTGLTLAEHLVAQKDGTIATVIDAAFILPPNSFMLSHVELWYSKGAGWSLAGLTSDNTFRIWDVEDLKTYTVAAVSVNSLGERAKIQNAPQAQITVLGKTVPPPVPTSFMVSTQPDGTREFTWTLISPPVDLAGYHIRYYLGSTSDWGAMTPLHNGLLLASTFESNQLAAGTYTFAIKSVDTTGNESATALFVYTTIGDPRSAGSIEDVREEPTWTGTKTSCHVDATTGWLAADGTATWTTLPATWAGWTNWNAVPASPITYLREIDLGAVVMFIPLVSVTVDGTPTIEESHSDDGFSWSGYAATGTTVTARYIRIRVSVSGSYPKIKTMRSFLSAQPVAEIIEDQDSSALTGSYRLGVGDIRVPITESYAVIRKVDITLQSVGAGWSWELIDKDTTVGPRVKIYNASDAAADAVFDATVTGL